MVWNEAAYVVTIKAIGAVESNFNYGAINPSDAITLGIAQWYGTRAANLLFRIKDEAPVAFDDFCPGSIKTSMLSHSASDSWWNSRHVTREEATGLRNLLTRGPVKTIQTKQFISDVSGYLNVAAAWGLNKDSETDATAFFCTVYHQSPRAASQICGVLPSKATLNNIYQAALNNSIVGPYKSRQTTAYNIIKNGDMSGTDDTSDDPLIDDNDLPDGGDGDDGGNGGNRRRSNETYMVDRGKVRILYHKNGSTTTFFKSGGVYLPVDDNEGAKYTNDNPNPDPNTNNDDGDTPPATTDPNTPKGTAGDIIAFARTKLGDYSYSQGPGRMTPDASGYSDCSAFLVWAFQKAGNVSLGGTYTGNLCTRGRFVKEGRPDESDMNPGDLIFYRWSGAVRSNSPFDHVAMYCGGGRRISMGRTPGPDEKDWMIDINYALGRGGRVQVRRYL